VACAVGVASHIVGDMATREGCPLAWPLTLHHYRLWPPPLAFTTNTRPERLIVAPGLLVVLGFLAWHAVPLHL